jgi:integrase
MGREGTGVEVRDSSIRIRFVGLDGEVYRERLTTPEGKPLAPTAGNLRAAENTARAIRKAVALGTFTWAEFFPASRAALAARAAVPAVEEETLGALLDLWLKSKGNLPERSRLNYASAVRFWKRLLGEHTAIRAITHKRLRAEIGGYPWPSVKRMNDQLIGLRGAFALEFNGATSASNPMIGIENGKTIKTLPDPFTVAERDLILADIREHYDPRVYAYFLWQFFTGMRPEEAIALRWSDIDWQAETVRVQRVRTAGGSERDGTKTGMVRDVDLLPQALEALRIMRPYTQMKRVERKGDPDDACDIFERPEYQGGPHGGRHYPAAPWHDERRQRDHYWKPALKRAKVRWRVPYNCRHTFASTALMTGTPPAYIAAQLGHSVKVLLEKYARWVPGNDAHAARDRLRAAMAAPGNTSQNSPQNAAHQG